MWRCGICWIRWELCKGGSVGCWFAQL
jgi:hypothetical protein